MDSAEPLHTLWRNTFTQQANAGNIDCRDSRCVLSTQSQLIPCSTGFDSSPFAGCEKTWL
jgi:hypothetical protein